MWLFSAAGTLATGRTSYFACAEWLADGHEQSYSAVERYHLAMERTNLHLTTESDSQLDFDSSGRRSALFLAFLELHEFGPL